MSETRAAREAERYNAGLDRDVYDRVLRHCGHHFSAVRSAIIEEHMRFGEGGKILELGSQSWLEWVDVFGIRPAELHCVNISEKEIENGRKIAAASSINLHFHVGDAHAMDFDDDTFDVVFGGGILHHLDFEVGVREALRVLKPSGVALFHEPLDMNPVGRFVRALTPRARTEDEQPLRTKQLRFLEQAARCKFYYEEFMSVPLGVISGLFTENPDNLLTRIGFSVDRSILSILPVLGPYYRHVMIVMRPHPA